MIAKTISLLLIVFISSCVVQPKVSEKELNRMVEFLELRVEKKVNKHLVDNYLVDQNSTIPIRLVMKSDGVLDRIEFDDEVNPEQINILTQTIEEIQPINEYKKYDWHEGLAKLWIRVYPVELNASALDAEVIKAKRYVRKLALSNRNKKCEPYTEFKQGVEERTTRQLVCVIDLYQPTLGKLYQVARAETPGLAGVIVFKLKIKGGGGLAYAEVANTTIKDSDFVNKIKSVFELIVFPAHKAMGNSRDFEYPVNFSAKQ